MDQNKLSAQFDAEKKKITEVVIFMLLYEDETQKLPCQAHK